MSNYIAGHYIDGRRRSLGLSLTTAGIAAAGANFIVPGSGPIVAVGASVLSNLFGNNRDAQRQANVDWFAQGVRQGSPYAGRIMIGGTQNTGSNETRQWQKAIDSLLSDPSQPLGAATMRAAQAQGAAWNDPNDKHKVESEILALNSSSSSSYVPSTSTPRPTSLPTMTTTAPFNWTPVLLGVGILAGAAILPQLTGGRRRSRRR